VEGISDSGPKGIKGSNGGLADQRFQLGEQLFNRIEVGRVARQVEHACPDGFDGVANPWRGVQEHDLAGMQSRGQELLNIDAEALRVDRTVEHQRRDHAVVT
jgi:hypothetical protein